MSGYNLGHVGLDDGRFEALVLELRLDLGLGVEHRQFMLLVRRTVPGIEDRPNEGQPKAQERAKEVFCSPDWWELLRGCANEKRPRQLPDRAASPKNSVIPLARSLGTFVRPRVSVHLAVHPNPEAWPNSIV